MQLGLSKPPEEHKKKQQNWKHVIADFVMSANTVSSTKE